MSSQKTIARIDNRPFFEKVLTYAVQSNLIEQEAIDRMVLDAAKGTVQVAAHFGSSHLHADLDNARIRVVNLVSLYLQESCNEDIDRAAKSLRDQAFLLHSRSGNALLRQLFDLPASTIITGAADVDFKEFQDRRTLLQPFSLAEFRKEHENRLANDAILKLAFWFADRMNVSRGSLSDFDATAVIRTGILTRLGKSTAHEGRGRFIEMIQEIRLRARTSGKLSVPAVLLADVPQGFQDIAEKIRRKIVKRDVPLLLDATLPMDVLFSQLESYYYIDESSLDDVGGYDALISQEWREVTKGKEDPFSRLTIFMCLATGLKPKPVVSLAEARKMIRAVRKNGFDSMAVTQFITAFAPFELREALTSLWEEEFFPEAEERLSDVNDQTLARGVRFLAEHCMVKEPKS